MRVLYGTVLLIGLSLCSCERWHDDHVAALYAYTNAPSPIR